MTRLRDQSGQALLMVLAILFVLGLGTAYLAAYGQAMGGRGRYQRVADLSAMSAARVMRTTYPRLFEPPVLPDGIPNPHYMSKPQYLALARAAAGSAASRNGERLRPGDVTFPDILSFAPVRVKVRLRRSTTIRLPGRRAEVPVRATAVAALSPGGSVGALLPQAASLVGRLVSRMGKPMRPDTAAAFDRLAAGARAAGITLSITSAYRSDDEQARLFAAHPDPKWVAPPGKSLHRLGTELDLGPPSAYGWLAANAHKYGFVKRYSWEPWHFGLSGGASAAHPAQRSEGPEESIPSFVPARWHDALARASQRWNVPVELLAAQLYAESNFNPFAQSPAGAKGIAQFMPGTARSYGLDNPFDGVSSIDAQAHLMHDLLRQFKTAALALAAYNAGAGAVQRAGGIPAIAETQGYVSQVLGLMSGAGALPGGLLFGIRLVE